MKRFLCICEGGNVRSSALVFILKHYYNREAIACGWRFTGEETMKMLCKWAETIIVMQAEFVGKLPKFYQKEALVVDVGPDRFGTPFHGELQQFLKQVADDWNSRGWFNEEEKSNKKQAAKKSSKSK